MQGHASATFNAQASLTKLALAQARFGNGVKMELALMAIYDLLIEIVSEKLCRGFGRAVTPKAHLTSGSQSITFQPRFKLPSSSRVNFCADAAHKTSTTSDCSYPPSDFQAHRPRRNSSLILPTCLSLSMAAARDGPSAVHIFILRAVPAS